MDQQDVVHGEVVFIPFGLVQPQCHTRTRGGGATARLHCYRAHVRDYNMGPGRTLAHKLDPIWYCKCM